jgi:tetratricopeptide (TPR) repeat protein
MKASSGATGITAYRIFARNADSHWQPARDRLKIAVHAARGAFVMSRIAFSLLALFLAAPVFAQLSLNMPRLRPANSDTLPITKLAPAKIIPNLCLLKYRISTRSPECQAHFDQGLGYFYSYVWMEAARSFETAAKLDPDCAMAWWGLSRAMEEWRGNANEPLKKAQALLPKCSERERRLITARLQQKGLEGKFAYDEERRKAAIKTLDELISFHEDDEEAWFARARLGGDGRPSYLSNGGHRVAEIPFYKALLRINPLHPGANHELVHIYEGTRRPALGWPHAEQYIESSPGIPHAWHMQAHLAMRLGKWEKSTDRSLRAIELQREYHRTLNVAPKDDHQFDHHLETLTTSLIHDGRFREARAIKAEAQGHKYRHDKVWFRLHLAERDWAETQKIIDQQRKRDKNAAAYYAALVALAQNDPERARPEVEVLRQATVMRKLNPKLEKNLWEVQGLLLCQTGAADEGLKLLYRCVEKTKDDYDSHAWGHGAYYMEQWGQAALSANKLDVAEEAFLEALAHDPGSAKAAMGLQLLCERQGRTEEATRYAALARKFWRHAEVRHFEGLKESCGVRAD